MTAARRWWIVTVGVLLLVSTPVLVRALPAHDQQGLSAAALLARIQASRGQSFTGLAQTAGRVGLPANDALPGLSALLATTNRVRVWWRDPATWRVATLRTTGETDLVHSGGRTVRWTYESKQATLSPDVPVRLPDIVDVLPHELARRALDGARRSELSRLPARRVAGRSALGLRLVPASAVSSVSRVDVYADRATGVPLQVDLVARGGRAPFLTSRLVDFRPGRPDPSTLRFHAPPDAQVSSDDIVDLAAAADRFALRIPPASLAGLPAREPLRGSVGVYGRGPTVLLAVPLWRRTACRIRDDLRGRPGVRSLHGGLLLAVPPLRLLLARQERSGTTWLLAGTVTEGALTRAADALAAHRPGVRGEPRRELVGARP
jgi:hypothetical protein